MEEKIDWQISDRQVDRQIEYAIYILKNEKPDSNAQYNTDT